MIYLNGRIQPPDQVQIDPSDRGLLLGDGLFETLRCRDGAPEFLSDHLARLAAGAEKLGIPLAQDPETLASDITALLAANGLDRDLAALRITLTRGSGPRGLVPPTAPSPNLLMTVAPGSSGSAPARVKIAAIRRNEHSPLSQLKSLNYLDAVLARQDAADSGADEAILLNTAGRLACASVANIFLVRGRSLLTPPPSEGVLSGIARAQILKLVPDLGLSPIEVPLERHQLTTCDEAFLTNSLIGVRPVVQVDQAALGSGQTGPVTERVSEAWDRLLD